MAPSDIKIVSANCQGLRDVKKRTDVLNYLADSNPDILCLQDTHWLTDDQQHIKKLWKGECLLNGTKTNARGVAILFGKNFEYKTSSIQIDDCGNFISVLLTLSEFSIRIINIYAPNTDNPDFFEFIKKQIELSEHDYCLICGDFNLVLDPIKDCRNYKNINNPRSRQYLLQAMGSLELRDAFRHLNKDLKRFTWHRKNPIRCARLDYFLVSNSLMDLINKCAIKPGYRSDHSMIELHLTICKFQRGRGLWKFNCSLLKDKEYLIYINNLIDKVKISYAVPVYNPNSIMQLHDSLISFTISDDQFLETLLMQIRGETIKFASALRKKNEKKENDLKKEIELLENCNENINFSDLDTKKKELESFRMEKLEGIMIRSRAQWLSEGEKPSKYFCSLEKHYYVEKTVKKLVTNEGHILTGQKEILDEIKCFYKKLFSNRDAEMHENSIEHLNNLTGLTKLSEYEANLLEGNLTIDEISNSLKSMKNQKCPGVDGFPAEFFKVFWGKLKYFILRSLNYGYSSRQMSISMRQCIISCLPKGEKPRQFLKNWRPISLLSVVYKIASSALASRLRMVLNKIISDTQSGFMTGRFIGENTRLIYDLMHYTQNENIPGLLMLIDFQKAFDSVSWKFLYSALTLFGFKENFCKWIRILNTNVKAAILQCGVLSDFFDIERGCRQGDPISPYLFIICAQIMFLLIKNEKNLKGISINGLEHKITQFADDTTLILDGSKDSLVAALNVLEIFGSMSGLHINTEKTKLIWIGKKRYSSDKLDVGKSLVWGSTSFTFLGLTFSVDLDTIVELNFTQAIQSLEKLLRVWSKRHLTPLGKVTVIKTLALSKLTHLFLTIPSPGKDIFKKIEVLFYKFIWNGKPDKVKRSVLTKKLCEGGLNMIDVNNFDRALKITWLRRFYSSCNTPWFKVAIHYLNSVKKLIMLGSIYSFKLSKRICNKFWAQAVDYWSTLIVDNPVNDTNDASKESLWSNPKVSKVEMSLPHWFNKGIIAIGDLMHANGKFISQKTLTDIYNIKTNYLEYHRVISCVKKYLSGHMKCTTHQKPLIPNQVAVLIKSKKGSKDFYNILNRKCTDNLIPQYTNWEKNLHISLSKEKLKLIFRTCFKTVKNNDMIWMQYRVLYRILGTNDYLFKIKKHVDGICNFCYQSKETILHLLVECENVNRFWCDIKVLIKNKLRIDLPIDPPTVILGDLSSNRCSIQCNIIYLAAKLYIFKVSRTKGTLTIGSFTNYIKKIYLEQEYVAKIEFKHKRFTNIWSSFIMLFAS